MTATRLDPFDERLSVGNAAMLLIDHQKAGRLAKAAWSAAGALGRLMHANQLISPADRIRGFPRSKA